MNSEELEQSLRAEFENYLKGVLGQVREDIAEFQIKIEAELDQHRSRLNEAFTGLTGRLDGPHETEGGFTEAVVEHLRLARDEGAKITAMAIAEAEELERANAPVADLSALRDAVNDISSKDSQSAILKSLITHAAKYTSRGAFFIIKSEQFVGWKIFGPETDESDTTVRDIHFAVSEDTIIGGAARALSTVEGSFGTYTDDTVFLDPLNFGRPDRMYAVPLVARGRGVAVLYADFGQAGVTVNTDALEMLVRIAGLTVELLASSKAARTDLQPEQADDTSDTGQEHTAEAVEPQYDEGPYAEPEYHVGHEDEEEPQPHEEPEVHDEHRADTPFAPSPFDQPASAAFSDDSYATESTDSTLHEYDFRNEHPVEDVERFEERAPSEVDAVDEVPEVVADDEEHQASADIESEIEPEVGDDYAATEPSIVFDPGSGGTPSFEPTPFAAPIDAFEPAVVHSGEAVPVVSAPVVDTIPARPTGSRLSDRHVDLPIEVEGDERRLHNDARRFARLLVSEIKLYNEKKVEDGRAANDLYERLREAIDRSREMYDKRVQPPVASKFDYFHYELVSSLADGDESRLGPGYPGATV